jgi:hypothetical protein
MTYGFLVTLLQNVKNVLPVFGSFVANSGTSITVLSFLLVDEATVSNVRFSPTPGLGIYFIIHNLRYIEAQDGEVSDGPRHHSRFRAPFRSVFQVFQNH